MIVIDASIAIKLIHLQEEGSKQAIELLKKHIEGEEEIIIPQLLFLEVANALTTKTHVHEDQIREGIGLLYQANFLVFNIKEENVLDASLLARKYKTSVYDMLYAVIAKEKKNVLNYCRRKIY
jgi:predicted nucleic acid-binding protein